MSAPALSPVSPVRPPSRLARLVTLDRIATAAAWVFWLFTIATAVQALVALTRTGTLFAPTLTAQPGHPLPVWLATAPPLLPHGASVLIQSGLAPGVQATWNGAILGVAHPTAGQALAFTLALLPAGLLRIGTLYLVMRLARTTARDGVYTVQAARRVLILGWWLLAGALVASIAEGLTRLNLLGQLVTRTAGLDWLHWPASWGVSWPVFWFGLGLVIFARIMRVSAGMRADLEGTI
jgi:hypothetical protein